MVTSMLHIRLDDEVKAKATEALAAMGLSASDAVRLLFRRIVADQAFSLELSARLGMWPPDRGRWEPGRRAGSPGASLFSA